MNEEWLPVPGWEGLYDVSSFGNVRTRMSSIILRRQDHYHGYLFVHLWNKSARKKYFIHRLVALAFLPNPENKPFVNHKDGVKSNCVLSNLEWATVSENTQHYYDHLRPKPEVEMEF